MLMDHIDTLHVDRSWSEVLCFSIMTHLSDPEFKVSVFEKLVNFTRLDVAVR